jgi:acyl-CoA synthetase (AMP-forming)/AMP-acid ligase II
LKYVRSITAPLSPLQARRFRGQFGITVLNGYGQTEIGGEIVGWSGADAKAFGESKLGSVGRPHREVHVRAVDADGTTLPSDEAGELWVLTPAMSAGYAAGGDLSDRLSPDGWFRTGDIGRVDADGFVWIEGRVSDMINRGGLKVYPEQVAEVVRLSPAVAECAVVGVADARLGEVPWAFVVPTDPSAPASDDALEALARQHLAPYKVPVGWTTIDELPRNEVGKVLSTRLLELTAQRQGKDRP